MITNHDLLDYIANGLLYSGSFVEKFLATPVDEALGREVLLSYIRDHSMDDGEGLFHWFSIKGKTIPKDIFKQSPLTYDNHDNGHNSALQKAEPPSSQVITALIEEPLNNYEKILEVDVRRNIKSNQIFWTLKISQDGTTENLILWIDKFSESVIHATRVLHYLLKENHQTLEDNDIKSFLFQGQRRNFKNTKIFLQKIVDLIQMMLHPPRAVAYRGRLFFTFDPPASATWTDVSPKKLKASFAS